MIIPPDPDPDPRKTFRIRPDPDPEPQPWFGDYFTCYKGGGRESWGEGLI